MSRTTCSILSSSGLGASLKSRCASSKKNTSFGFSRSPTSGRCSKSSASIHNRNVEYSLGEFRSLSAASMLTTPRPLLSVCIRSLRSSMGSPKNWLPPCCSISSSERWIAPIDAAETLPYSVVNCDALSPICCNIARRSLASSSSKPLSSAILNTSANTPCCVSFRLKRRPSRSGPISDTVARTGCPALPNVSQNTTGHAFHCGALIFNCASRSCIFGEFAPAAASPARSPFTSAMKTGTPIIEKRSAITCSVTVLPVPVAPVIRP